MRQRIYALLHVIIGGDDHHIGSNGTFPEKISVEMLSAGAGWTRISDTGRKGKGMRSRRAIMIGSVLAATLLISAGVAQAAPALAPVSQARQSAAAPLAGPSFSQALDARGAAPLAAAGSTRHGCPYGYACMYTTSGWNNNTPEHEYYYYGCYNLSNEYGTRWIYNNQYGGGDIALFAAYDCYGGPAWAAAPGGWGSVDITPINSVEIYH